MNMNSENSAIIPGANFEQLFMPVTPENISENVFSLAGKIFPVITAGCVDNCNAMTASGGGYGVLFKRPATWCILQSTRYTLEMMLKFGSYTLSYFGEEYRDDVLFLGSKSGRDSEKMSEVNLSVIETPLGNVAFREAFLVIECKLVQVTTVHEADFYSEEAINYIGKVYKDPDEYRKYVFGEIRAVWEKRGG
ncbi:MAG: flavin reductase [Tannerellaceae bacterium]|jgi:flavin reductase (DIM6/NTAB) family NADH-FMN oxidoreductase RutF|nr:flavin reductase [Tannerellaceae bacterium]